MKSYLKYFYKINSKKLRIGIISNTGRNFSGRICIHHRFTGNKHKYRFIDYKRRLNSYGFIYKIIKDSKWTSFIGGIYYLYGLTSFILLSEGVNLYTKLYSGSILNNSFSFKPGSAIPLSNYNLFTVINNVELFPYKGSSLCRSAGSSALILKKENNLFFLKLKSGWNIFVSEKCIGSLGIASNSDYRYIKIMKAGISSALGRRPSVRGVAMNPVDHPHGGGEGRKSPRKAQVSP